VSNFADPGMDSSLCLLLRQDEPLNTRELLTSITLERTEKDIADLHGIGPTTIPKLKTALTKVGLAFRKK